MEQESLLDDPRFWVALAFVVCVAFVYKKVVKLLLNALDERSARIKKELDEAHALREEAEAILADYQQKQAHYLKEAQSILDNARRDADVLRTHAEEELKLSMEERTKHAMERIAQEEANAIADVRNHVVDIALAAARTLIVDHVSTLSQDELVQLAITDIERKIH